MVADFLDQLKTHNPEAHSIFVEWQESTARAEEIFLARLAESHPEAHKHLAKWRESTDKAEHDFYVELSQTRAAKDFDANFLKALGIKE